MTPNPGPLTAMGGKPVPAKESGTYADASEWPTPAIMRPLTLAPRMLEVWAPVNINASDDRFGEPVYAAPNIAFGLTQNATVRLLHTESYRPIGAVGGICFNESDAGCPEFYNNTTLEGAYGLRLAWLEAAPHIGLSVRQWDQFFFGAEGGIQARLRAANLVAIQVDPTIYLGFTNRDDGGKEVLGVPATITLQVLPQLAVFGLIGLYAPIDDFGDFYTIPVGGGLQYTLGNALDVGAQFTWTNLLGNNSTGEFRLVTPYLAVRL